MTATASPTVDTTQEHLIPFADAPWAFWKTVLLRGTGFAAERVLRLASPQAVEAADHARAAEDAATRARQSLVDRINDRLDAIREAGEWKTNPYRKDLLKAQRSLYDGKVNRPVTRLLDRLEDSPVREATRAAIATEEEAEARRAAYDRAFAEALDDQSTALADLADDPRFEEAVIWQNRRAYQISIRSFLEQADEEDEVVHNKWQRQREELVASYIQRYCVKNDTIGFFGPAGWGRMVEGLGTVSLQPGENLLAKRGVFLEDWGLDAIAAILAEDEGVRPWLKPRRLPFVVLRASQLLLPGKPPQELPPPVAAVLQAADGSARARDLAAKLAEAPDNGVESVPQVFQILGEFAERKLIVWTFEVPIGPHALGVLSEQIDAIGDEAVRARCREPLQAMERCCATIAAAAGNPTALDQAIEALEETFTDLTGTGSERKQGQTYGGRTLVYEDTVRDVDLELGATLREQLEPPLSLVLTSARWLLLGSAAHARSLFHDLYRRAAEEMGQPVVPCGFFWRYLEPFVFGPQQERLRALLPQLQEKWRQILAFDPEERRVKRSSETLRAAVEEAFAIDSSWEPWSLARCNSPDILIAAPGVEAIEKGEHRFVLGELHVGKNTFNAWSFMALSPHREKIFRDMDRDTPEPQVIPLPPKDNPRITTRTHKAHLSEKDFFIPPMDGSVIVPPERAVSFGDAMLMEQEGRLIIRAQGGRTVLDPLTFFGDFLMFHLSNYFDLLGPGEHWPRITIDRLVVHRESWFLSADDVEFANLKESSERFLGARRWAADQGLPRFVFLRTPRAQKPFFVDFESPILIDLFAKMIRDLQGEEESWLALNEMLPTPEQSWLEDREGNHYASELRIVCKDLRV